MAPQPKVWKMGRKGYGASSLTYVGTPTNKVVTFAKRDKRGGAICNRCRNRIMNGERAKQTLPGAWKHYPKCPTVPTPDAAGWSSKHGDA